MDKVIVVDQNDQILKETEKLQAHQVNGQLHRGFIIFIRNSKGELLVLQRSPKKMLWPLFWDGCCSHPRRGESYLQASQRRLKEELGFTCPLQYLTKFYYRAVYQNVGSEEEICAVLLGRYDGPIKPHPDEIAAFRWLSLNHLKEEVQKKPGLFAPWFKKSLKFLPPQN